MIRRVLVLWADNASGNFGVRVLAQGMAELARRAWGQDIEVAFQDYGPGESGVSFGTRAIVRDFGRRSGAIKQRLANHDVIIDSGAGDSFADIYGPKRLSFMVYAREAARRLGVPVVMGPQTIGPFESRLGRVAARRLLKNSELVLSRDSESGAYAASLGRPVDGIVTDVAFALPRHRGLSRSGVLVNVSGLLWFSDRHVDSARYRDAVRRLVQSLLADGRDVRLLAHTVNKVHKADDVAAIQQLQLELRKELQVIVPADLEDVRLAVAGAELVLGSRMHACLNALAEGTPAIPWAYSRKFEPLMNDLGWHSVIDLRTEADPVERTQTLLGASSSGQMRQAVEELLSRTDEHLSVAAAKMEAIRGDRHV